MLRHPPFRVWKKRFERLCGRLLQAWPFRRQAGENGVFRHGPGLMMDELPAICLAHEAVGRDQDGVLHHFEA